MARPTPVVARESPVTDKTEGMAYRYKKQAFTSNTDLSGKVKHCAGTAESTLIYGRENGAFDPHMIAGGAFSRGACALGFCFCALPHEERNGHAELKQITFRFRPQCRPATWFDRYFGEVSRWKMNSRL
jgi:hypothetical protein